jgi:RND superfamily putative drug exporter
MAVAAAIRSDGKTTLVLVEFTTRFLDKDNGPLLSRIETLIAQEGELVGQPDNLFARQLIPPGLSLSLSGPAIVGRDLRSHSDDSTQSIVQWALLMAVAGLLVFYRAPFLALAPLLAALLSVGMAMAALAHLAGAGVLEIFAGLDNYLVVILGGASLLSGLAMVARESESRFLCPTLEDAATNAIKRAGPELAGGGLLLLAGWGMMVFAQYGKLQQLGAALVIGVVFVLLSTLTFLPAVMVLLGRWAYWPNLRAERISADRTWSLPRATWSRLMGRGWSLGVWQAVYSTLREKPRRILLACLLAMGPFIAVAVLCQGQLTYGLLSQLPEELASVKGAEIIQQQFPAGTTGPVTLLLEHPRLEFHTIEGGEAIGELSDELEQRKEQFGIADIRSVAYPLGLNQKDVATHTVFERTRRHRSAVEYYVGDKPPLASHATKLEIVFDADPFSRESIEQFETLRRTLPELLPPALAEAKWHLLGAPASIRDLKTVTDRDRRLIQCLVIAGVFLCLVCLLREGALSAGLVGLGLLNYLASLGATFAAFWWWNPGGFPGLDWTVPTLLFVVLMSLAVQGYWWLLARIREEQQELGPSAGPQAALEQSGSLFLGSGLIAAGVFASLLGGSLVGLNQFGFGLTCGLLLDSLVIRPLLLPACLLLTSSDQTQADPIPSQSPVSPPKETLTATGPRLSEE